MTTRTVPGLTAANTTLAPILVGVPDACALLNCGRSTLYRLIRQGDIKATSIGRTRCVSVASIQKYAARRLAATSKPERHPRRIGVVRA